MGRNKNRNVRKRKLEDVEDDEASSASVSEVSDNEPPAKKRRTSRRQKPKKTKEDQSDSSDSDSDDDEQYKKTEKRLREMLDVSSVLLQNENGQKKFEIIVKNKSYVMVKGKVDQKAKEKTKTFTTKKKAYSAALDLLLKKIKDNWIIVESESDEEDEAIFNDYLFAVSGSFSKPQKDVIEMIQYHGGQYVKQLNSQTDFLVVKVSNPDLKTSKCVKAKKLKVPIITESFLRDCIKKDKVLGYSKYLAKDNKK